MKHFVLRETCTAIFQEGDITEVAVDAIVNAANEWMLGGAGVDGAIHEAAGPQLLEACRKVPEVAPDTRCPRGEARITPGFDLPSRYVIHTVGPIYRSAEVSAPVLAAAFRSSLELANEHGLGSIAFPAVSCGVYGYPPADAAAIALDTCRHHAGGLRQIRFVLFGQESYAVWLDVAGRMLEPASPV